MWIECTRLPRHSNWEERKREKGRRRMQNERALLYINLWKKKRKEKTRLCVQHLQCTVVSCTSTMSHECTESSSPLASIGLPFPIGWVVHGHSSPSVAFLSFILLLPFSLSFLSFFFSSLFFFPCWISHPPSFFFSSSLPISFPSIPHRNSGVHSPLVTNTLVIFYHTSPPLHSTLLPPSHSLVAIILFSSTCTYIPYLFHH